MTAEHNKQGAAHGQVEATAKEDAPRLTYTAHQDATREAEVQALARAYRYILECAEREKALGISDDGVHAEVGCVGGLPKERPDGEGSSA